MVYKPTTETEWTNQNARYAISEIEIVVCVVGTPDCVGTAKG